jgi:hypothetical protein
LLRVKIADTGTDPIGALKEFINHDIFKPLDRPKNDPLYQESIKEFYQTRGEKWALNNCKIASSPEKIPHMQPFKTQYFPKLDPNFKPVEPKLLKTDHISQIPNLKRNFSEGSSPKFVDQKST